MTGDFSFKVHGKFIDVRQPGPSCHKSFPLSVSEKVRKLFINF